MSRTKVTVLQTEQTDKNSFEECWITRTNGTSENEKIYRWEQSYSVTLIKWMSVIFTRWPSLDQKWSQNVHVVARSSIHFSLDDELNRIKMLVFIVIGMTSHPSMSSGIKKKRAHFSNVRVFDKANFYWLSPEVSKQGLIDIVFIISQIR